jgi:hypothetical protein
MPASVLLEVKPITVDNCIEVDECLSFRRLIPRSTLRIEMRTNMDVSFPSAVSFDVSPIDTDSGVVYAAIVLLGLYILIVLEVSCSVGTHPDGVTLP